MKPSKFPRVKVVEKKQQILKRAQCNATTLWSTQIFRVSPIQGYNPNMILIGFIGASSNLAT